jgi:polysaccharide export outer membrane protein
LLLGFLAACGSSRPPPKVPPLSPPDDGRPAEEVLAELHDWIHPAEASPVALGPGDSVSIDVKNHPEYSISRKVIPAEGVIDLTGLPDVSIDAVGKTPRELEKEIAEAYKLVLNNPYVTVNISGYATRVVYVSGAVKSSGKYGIPKDTTLTLIRVLTEAGWLTDQADGTAVRILRDDPQARRQMTSPPIDLDVLLRAGVDIPLRANDSIQVPKTQEQFVSIWGKGVTEPGNYPWQEGLTISRLIAIAGGLAKFADSGNVKILRPTVEGQQTYTVDLNAVFDNEEEDFVLRPRDVVRIDDTFF